MARVLIVYASRNGQTGKVARCIAATVREQGHVPELADAARLPKNLDLRQFGAVIVGSPVIAGGYLRPVVRFVQKYRGALSRLPSAFFSVGLAMVSRTSDGRAQTMRLVEKLLARTGWRPEQVELVAGALPYTRYGWLVRRAMRRIVAKEGGDTDTTRDYEYTDWAAVDRFAAQFVTTHLPGPISIVRRTAEPGPIETAHLPPPLPTPLHATR